MNKSENIANIAKALVLFQNKKIKIPKGESVKDYNGKIKYTYAKIEAIIDSIQPALSECGLAINQFTGGAPGQIKVTTMLTHAESGEYMCEEKIEDIIIPMTKDGKPSQTKEQAYGSMATYYKKYGIASILCLATTDDEILDPDANPIINNADLIKHLSSFTLNSPEHEIIIKGLMHYGVKTIDELTTSQLQTIVARINKG